MSEAQRMDVEPGLPGFKSHLHHLFVIGSGSRFLSSKGSSLAQFTQPSTKQRVAYFLGLR